MLAFPWLVGAGLVLVTLGHCVVPALFGAVDDCVPGVGLCVRDGAPTGRATLLLSLLFSLRPAHALWRALSGLLALRRAALRLQSLGQRNGPRDAWLVPGTVAAVLGFPKSELFIGEAMHCALSERELDALIAHERAHQRNGDLWRKFAARVLASAHFDATGRELLDALDLAIEQRCDEHASNHVQDPIIVAQALVQAATVHANHDAREQAPASLAARIHALCAPSWVAQPLLALAATTLITVATVASILFAHRVHIVAESMLSALARA
jgi:Zn-dependent protease with chaperone function